MPVLGLDVFSVIIYVAAAGIGLGIAAYLRSLAGPRCDYERYKERIEELKAELRETRERYERLLKDVAIRNEMMRGLWDAYASGGLVKCVKDGGNPRVLADGAVICDKGPDSYLIVSAKRSIAYDEEGWGEGA